MVVKIRNMTFISLLLFGGCKVGVGTNESEQFKVLPISGSVSFEMLKSYVLTPSCIRCHSWAGNEAEVQQRVIIGNPSASILYQNVKSGQMPPSGALSSKYLTLIENYINSAKSAPTIELNSTFKSIQFHLINKSCLSCHNNSGTEISFEGYANVSRRANKIISILEEGDSADTPMPPLDAQGTRKAPLPTLEIQDAFRSWIAEGKLDN